MTYSYDDLVAELRSYYDEDADICKRDEIHRKAQEAGFSQVQITRAVNDALWRGV
jgi:uncharacterized protein Smg (DUF494 family)